MPENNWGTSFNNEAITTENRESFNTFASKYDSPEAAIVGGFNAQKAIGAPFKMPESMDKLPDDDSRSDFTTKARGLLGINIPKNVESLDGIDFKTGLAEGATVDDNFKGVIKNWAVEAGIDTGTLEKMIAFNNGPLAEFAQKAMAEKTESDNIATAKSVNDELIKHPDIGSAEKLQELSELMRRAIKNSGISAEEYEEIGDSMADSLLVRNPVMARTMLKLLAPLAKEGSTDGGSGTPGGDAVTTITPYEFKKSLHPASDTLWGDPNEKWETQDASLRQRYEKQKK